VTAVRGTPVSAFVTVSVTPGSTPPCVSVMVPEMAPLVFWAAAGPAQTNARIARSVPNRAIRCIDSSLWVGADLKVGPYDEY
jgi:hypothetical protein